MSGVAQQVEEAPGSPLSDLQERKLLPNTRAKRKVQLLSARESDLYSTVVSSLLFQGCFKLLCATHASTVIIAISHFVESTPNRFKISQFCCTFKIGRRD